MSEDVKKKAIELGQLKNLIFGKDIFDIVIKNDDGTVIKVKMRSLNSDDMSNINSIINSREIAVENLVAYSNEMKVLKIVYAIEAIEVNEDSVIKTEDKLALEKAIRSLPETVIKALTFKYDEYTTTIYDKLEKKTSPKQNTDSAEQLG